MLQTRASNLENATMGGGACAESQAANGGKAKRGFGRDITNKEGEGLGGAKGKMGKLGKKIGLHVSKSSSSSNMAAAVNAAPPPPGMTQRTVYPPEVKTRKMVPSARAPTDIDARDALEPLAVTEYVQELYVYLREQEVATRLSHTYMNDQPHVNERMRSILVDWLVEVHLKFKLVPDTLYLTVSLLDKYMERQSVSRQNLQLVGVTALLLASKYEEIYPPEIRDLVYITDRAYNKEQILEMESNMLKAMQFRITMPTVYCFLLRYLKAAHADKKIVQLACFIAERMLQEYSMLQYPPSMVASAAILVARKNLNRNAWSPTLEKYSEYSEEDLAACLNNMHEVMNARNDLSAVKKKFSSQKFGAVANMNVVVL